MKYTFTLFAILFAIQLHAQEIVRKNYKTDGARSTLLTDPIRIIDDRIYFKGRDLFDSTVNYFLIELDTNLTLLKYLDLTAIDADIISGYGDFIKTSDNGFLLTVPTTSPILKYKFIKLSSEFEVEWTRDYIDSSLLFTSADKTVELDSTYLVFGKSRISDNRSELYVNHFDKEGNFLKKNCSIICCSLLFAQICSL